MVPLLQCSQLTSQGLVSSVGTYQIALAAKYHQKRFYALAESYKFLRYYPLRQTDLPAPKVGGQNPAEPLSFPSIITPLRQPGAATASTPTRDAPPTPPTKSNPVPGSKKVYEMTPEMETLNPLVDVTSPDLIDLIFTDLGMPLTPTSVSQYLVAQFST